MSIQRIKFKDIEQVPNIKINKLFKQQFQGSAPAPFVGRFGYPKVNIGILSPQFTGDMDNYESPKLWAKNDTSITEIAGNRYSLVNSRELHGVKDLKGRFLEIVQEVGMGKQSEVEIALKKPPQLMLKSEKEVMPFGPGSEIEKARLTSNTKVHTKVEKIVRDIDLKSVSAIKSLYESGFEENFLSKLLSVGNLGLKKNRKLVPTRWSITATDDAIGKQLITEVKNYPLGDYQVYFGGGWGNYYVLLFFPEIWSYELYEVYLNKSVNPWSKTRHVYSTDHEDYTGRKNYAEETAGGYYAARLSILEKMKQNKRQNSCLALRFILPEYNIPLGVWICREAARKSCQSVSLVFSSEESMLKHVQDLVNNQFSFNLKQLFECSKLLNYKKLQTRLNNYSQ